MLRFMPIASSRFLGYGLDDPGFESRQGQDVSVSSNTSTSPLKLTQPPIQWLPRLFPGDHSPSTLSLGGAIYPHPRTLLMVRVGNTVPISTCTCTCVLQVPACISHVTVKVKFSRYRPGVARRMGRGIVLFFRDRGTRRG